ncbi:MAG: TonB-dependent receptor [Chlorobiaceae bacterium]
MKKIALLVFLLATPEIDAAATLYPDAAASEAPVFKGGEITVTGKQDKKNEIISADDMERLDKKNITQAINVLPGINQSNFGARNEGMIYVRGFDMRQVPLYMDGIPLYVPYDGYVDPNRFTTFDLSQISISKGFTSVMFGPNTLGGAINMVSRKPQKKLEATVKEGLSFDNDQIASSFTSLNIGTNQGSWYVQTALSSIDSNFWPLSGSFTPNINENGGKRDNSATKDVKESFKVGYTPNSSDEYSISFINQDSNKGVPVYTGINPSSAVRYWKYTEWDKSSLYFIGKTAVGNKSYLKTRAYVDNYYNVLDSYDNATYKTQISKKAFTSIYDDQTFGGSVEYDTELISQNTLKLAVHEKYDKHKEYNIGQMPKEFEDNTLSLAAENSWAASDNLSVILGARRDFRNTIKAEDLQNNKISSFNLVDNAATNYQLAVVGHPDERQEVTTYIARTTRFPTLKDRYSYKFGNALPNPGLNPEQSWNYGVDYTIKALDKLKIQASIYQSKLNNVIQQVDNIAYINSIWVYQFQNTGKATFTGFECSVDWQPASWLKAFTAYSYIDRKNDSNPSLQFTDVPRNKLSGYIQFSLDKSTWAILETEYNSERYSSTNGKYKASSYGLLNLRASTSLYKAFSIQGSVENALDRNYAVSEGYPAPGRQYVLSVAYSL